MTGKNTNGAVGLLRSYGRISLAIDEKRLEGDGLAKAEDELRSIEGKLGIPKGTH